MLLLVGYDQETASLRFTVNNETAVILRNYEDLKQLKREANRQADPNNQNIGCLSPAKYIKLTAEGSWEINSTGWRLEYSRTVRTLEKWLNDTIGASERILREFVDENLYEQRKTAIKARQELELRPRQLQQYFASDVNIQLVVDLAYEDLSDTTCEHAIFVEPSCGDGRIMSELLARGNHHVAGCEIDPIVASVASLKCCTNDGNYNGNDGRCTVVVDDFLNTTRRQLLNGFSSAAQVIVVGSPPYTFTKGASRSNTAVISPSVLAPSDISSAAIHDVGGGDVDHNGDYPLLFLTHCAQVLRATKIVFLLPQRCGHPSFVERAAMAMNSTSLTEQPQDEAGVVGDSGAYRYALTHSQEADSSFELVGRVIRQPVIVQVWGLVPCW